MSVNQIKSFHAFHPEVDIDQTSDLDKATKSLNREFQLDLIVGIFGSGSAALRYFEILSKIGVQCVFIREDNEKLVRDNSTYPTVHFKNLKRVNSVIIASS